MGSRLRRLRRASAPDLGVSPSEQIVYCATGCTWWDSIERAGKLASGLPCCPFCQAPLFERTGEEWSRAALRHEVKAPGYVEVLRWSRGRSFRDWSEVKAAYAAAAQQAREAYRG